MSDTPWQERIAPMVRTLKIVVAGLVIGPLVFLVIAVVLGPQIGEGLEALTLTGIAFTVAALLAYAIVPNVIVSRGRQRIAEGTWQPPQRGQGQAQPAWFTQLLEETGDAGKLATLLHIRTIIAAALLEGLAFFWLIVHLLAHTQFSLILAIVLIVGVASHFPTHSRTVHWIEDQLQLVGQQRQFGR